MKIGDRIYVRGYVDEIRKDTVIVRNDGGYFGTIPSEVITGELPSAQPEHIKGRWIHKSQALDIVRGYWATCSSCGRGSFGGGNFCRECGSDNREVTT